MYKLLIVEDEEMIRKGLAYMTDWEKLGYIVVGEAANGRDGIEMIYAMEPDLVITDIRMPFVDGIHLLEQTRDACEYEAIIMSGYDEFEYAQKAISLGVSEYFLKPVEPEELEKVVARVTAKLDEKRRLMRMRETQFPARSTILDPALLGVRPNGNRHVERMLEYVRQNYSTKISLGDLSEAIGLSVSYLHNKFKEETGYTFNDYVNRYRIRQSIRLMTQTEMKIYEIAAAVGFQDYKYFNQVFRKYIGASPSEFLK